MEDDRLCMPTHASDEDVDTHVDGQGHGNSTSVVDRGEYGNAPPHHRHDGNGVSHDGSDPWTGHSCRVNYEDYDTSVGWGFGLGYGHAQSSPRYRTEFNVYPELFPLLCQTRTPSGLSSSAQRRKALSQTLANYNAVINAKTTDELNAIIGLLELAQ